MSKKHTTINDLSAVITLVLAAAKDAETAAAYDGKIGSSEAELLRVQAMFFQYGLNGVIPPEWKRFENMLDPEWQKYQQLKKKFEGT